MSIISLEDIEFFAFHGCYKEERIIGNRFLVSVSFNFDTTLAENTDDLSKTINYQTVYKIIKKEMEISSKLMEHVAGRIKRKICDQFPGISNLVIKISKLNPSIGGLTEKVSIILSD